jgi:hypothetical protein
MCPPSSNSANAPEQAKFLRLNIMVEEDEQVMNLVCTPAKSYGIRSTLHHGSSPIMLHHPKLNTQELAGQTQLKV